MFTMAFAIALLINYYYCLQAYSYLAQVKFKMNLFTAGYILKNI
jgi:hypothetical protein